MLRLAYGWWVLAALASLAAGGVRADGIVVGPKSYAGPLEEWSQEAIIIFQASKRPGEAVEDLILKITVEGEVDEFAWVVPFPTAPAVEEEDAALFVELRNYVQARTRRPVKKRSKGAGGFGSAGAQEAAVAVISREVVGSFDVAVVREEEAGALNAWLAEEGYREIENGDDVIDSYREKGYVFACIKVSDAALAEEDSVDIHPLRFTFRTGGRDAIYFPMRMTGLQSKPFAVNLYVFYRFWLNDERSRYGFVHRGFVLKYRDWDTPACTMNGGKTWGAPGSDPLLKDQAHLLNRVPAMLRRLHPGERYYLTNIQDGHLEPREVRQWKDDLWLFPYYTNRRFVPFDARPGGVAAAAYMDKEHTAGAPAGTEPAAASAAPAGLEP
jgi:hypothetical protein